MVRWEVPPSRRLAFVAVLVLTVAVVPVTLLLSFRAGGYLLAVALGLAAVLRAVLPDRLCLGLIVRTRLVDVAVAGTLAVGLAVVTGLVPTSA